MLVADGSLMAFSDAIHTSHATAVINPMVGDVDTSRLAIPGTQFAVYAFVLVNHRLQPRETGKEPQHRTYRTDSIAVSPSVPPRQYSYYNKGEQSDKEGRQAFQPHLRFIKSVTVGSLRKISEQVVPPAVYRGEQVAGYPPV